MKSSTRPRTTADLPQSITRQLNMYALAASAAGVGVLALPKPAEAKIVYTPTHQIIGLGDTYQLDLNHDGMPDFILTNGYFCDSGCFYNLGGFGAGSSNGIAAGRLYRARALRPGARIGFSRHFFPGNRPLVFVNVSTSGKYYQGGYWINVSNRYLGLQFKIKGKFHFGWARLSVKVQKAKITATLTGYAYETIPNKAILAGKTTGPDDSGVEQPNHSSLTAPTREPATLGLLATGAHGLSIWRRESADTLP
jgi:hypothetical protein